MNNNWKRKKIKKINEILFLTFSFFLIKKVNFDYNNYTADIYLETIGKTEILEEKIKKDKNIFYNEKERIMEWMMNKLN